MDRWLKLGLGIVVGIAVLWIAWIVLSAIFSFIMTVVGMLITLAILAVIVVGLYLIASRLFGGGGGTTSTSREREKIFE